MTAQQAFALETQLLIQTDGSVVVGPDVQRELVDTALSRRLDACAHERSADASAAPSIRDGHADFRGAVGATTRIELTDQAIAFVDRDEVDDVLVVESLLEALAPAVARHRRFGRKPAALLDDDFEEIEQLLDVVATKLADPELRQILRRAFPARRRRPRRS
jgi:hypothetical protein